MTTIQITSVLPDGPNAHGSVSVRLVDAGTGGAVGDEVIGGTQRVKLDVDGFGTIDLTPTADIDPPGTCWAFSVDGASPAVVRCITVPDSDTPVSWTDEAIQVGAPVPPDLFPLATSGDVGDVMTVVDDGNGKKLALRPPTTGGGGAVASVNGQTGTVVLDAADVDALPDTFAQNGCAGIWIGTAAERALITPVSGVVYVVLP